MTVQRHEEAPSRQNTSLKRKVAGRPGELQRGKDQLYLNKESLQTIYDALPLSAVVLEITPDGDIAFASVNQGFANEVGLNPDEIIGKHPRAVMKPWPQLEADFWRNFNLCIQTQQTVAYEQWFYGAEGQEQWYFIQLSPLVDDHGQVTHLVGAALEITARKQAEAALVQAKESAEAAAWAKSNFLSSISHELRTPLNAILGFGKLLSRDPNMSAGQRHYTEIITRSAEHLLVLISDILDMAKTEANQVEITPTFFDLHRLLQELYDLFHSSATEKGLELNLVRDDNLPQQIRTDPIKLRQVLLNLLSNAIKFTEAGSVTLRVSSIDDEAENKAEDDSLVSRLAPYALLHFAVSDTGPGIALQEMDELFESFTQVGRSRLQTGGTGLGLPLSHNYVALLGGELRVDSKLNQGTTFWFDLAVDLATPDQLELEDMDLCPDPQEATVSAAAQAGASGTPEIRPAKLLAEPDGTEQAQLYRGRTHPVTWQNSAIDSTHLRMQLAELSPWLVADLHQAAIDLDVEKLRGLLLKVADQDKDLARVLLTLVDNFAYDELFSLTNPVGEE
jgi:PAS domain S-box-containing protein